MINPSATIFFFFFFSIRARSKTTRQVTLRISREEAVARARAQLRRPRVFGQTFAAVRRKTPARSVSDRPACAVRVARVGASWSPVPHLMSIVSS